MCSLLPDGIYSNELHCVPPKNEPHSNDPICDSRSNLLTVKVYKFAIISFVLFVIILPL